MKSGKTYQFQESIFSWTLNEGVAKELKGGVHPDKTVHITVIFAINPHDGTVVVNLAELMEYPDFATSVKTHRKKH